MNEENIKMALSLIDASIGNLKPDKISQKQLDGLRKAIGEMYKDSTIEQICDILIEYDVPVLRFPKGASELCD